MFEWLRGKPREIKHDENTEKFYSRLEADTLARTIFGEAGGKSIILKEAIANVVLNRVAFAKKRKNYWWGNNVIQVCQKPYQFPCWNRSDPNFNKLQRATAANDLEFSECLTISYHALRGELPDHVHGSTHYHLENTHPYWARHETPMAIIEGHHFYKLS